MCRPTYLDHKDLTSAQLPRNNLNHILILYFKFKFKIKKKKKILNLSTLIKSACFVVCNN